MRLSYSQIATGLVLLAISGLTGFTLAISERVTRVETTLVNHQASSNDRIGMLESGRSTPISAEAVARFGDVEDRIEQLRNDVKQLAAGQREIMREIMKQNQESNGLDTKPKPNAKGG